MIDMQIDINDLVNALTYKQLLHLQFDIKHGGLQLRKLVEGRIKDMETSSRTVCASCGVSIPDSVSGYTLVFGPSDLRKKATCCGMDCFTQLVEKLKIYEGVAQKHLKQ